MNKPPMRKNEFEITDPDEIQKLLEGTSICHLGLSDGGQPYVVPMNFGYHDGHFYLHCATEGRKLNIIRQNNRVCVEVVIHSLLVSDDSACNWTTHYTSVIGFGRAVILEEPAEKEEALQIFMRSYTGVPINVFNPSSVRRMIMIRVDTDDIRAKQNPGHSRS